MGPLPAPYERPRVVERTPIDVPLVALVSVDTVDAGASATFRPSAPYERPRVADRTHIPAPLTLATSPLPTSAVFRPVSSGTHTTDDRERAAAYAAPSIEERAPIDVPLIGRVS